jgi:putative ATP-grasp target RiPP
MSETKPWLLSLATRQAGRVHSEPVAYDAHRQIGVVDQAGAMVPAVETSKPLETKKADIEKGEDRKDRWWQS